MKQKLFDQKCNICEYEWKSRKETPKSCPNCKRYDYRKVEVKTV